MTTMTGNLREDAETLTVVDSTTPSMPSQSTTLLDLAARFESLAGAAMEPPVTSPDDSNAIFNKIDANHDGVVSRWE